MTATQKKVISIIALIGLSQGMNLSFGALVGSIAQAYPEKSVDLIQLTVTIFNLSSILIGLASGYLAIRYSRKSLLILILSIYLVCGLAPIFIVGFWWLMFFRLCSGVAVGLATPVTMAAISELFDAKGRVKTSGIQGGCIGIGAFLGSLLGGYLANHGYRMGFLPYVYNIIPLLVVIKYFPDSPPVGGNRKSLSVSMGVIWLALAMFLYAIAASAFDTNISLHIGGPYAGNSTVSGIVCGFYSVVQAAMGFMMAALYRKLGRFTLPVAGISAAVGFYILSFSSANIFLLFLGAGLCGGSYCSFISQIIAEVTFRANAANTAMAIACIEIAKSCGRLISPLVLNQVSRWCFGGFSTFGVLLLAALIMTATNGTILVSRCKQRS